MRTCMYECARVCMWQYVCECVSVRVCIGVCISVAVLEFKTGWAGVGQRQFEFEIRVGRSGAKKSYINLFNWKQWGLKKGSSLINISRIAQLYNYWNNKLLLLEYKGTSLQGKKSGRAKRGRGQWAKLGGGDCSPRPSSPYNRHWCIYVCEVRVRIYVCVNVSVFVWVRAWEMSCASVCPCVFCARSRKHVFMSVCVMQTFC